MKSLDIISVAFIQRLTISIRFYTEPSFGVRCLGGTVRLYNKPAFVKKRFGGDRWAFDLSYISLIIEVW